jgi:dolichol kinase
MHERSHLEPLRLAIEPETRSVPAAPRRRRTRAFPSLRRQLRPVSRRVRAVLGGEAVHVASLRPANHARSLLHVASAAVALTAIVLAPTPWVLRAIALSFCGLAWSAEALRRLDGRVNVALMRVFGRVAHPHEHQRVNSATWYATALLGLALFGSPVHAAVGVVVLGVGDPMAASIGRRFGRVRLANGRSLEGSLAFVVFGGLAALLVLLALYHRQVTGLQAVGAASLAAVCGAAAELFSSRLDDNFTIPLSAAAGAALALALLPG